MALGFKTIPSAPEYEVSRGGRVLRKKDGKEMKRTLVTGGYYAVSIKGKAVRVHRLVAETYLANGKSIKGLVVHHRNGIKTDNRISNLMLCTPSEHRMEHQIEREFMAWACNSKKFKDFRKMRLESLKAENPAI